MTKLERKAKYYAAFWHTGQVRKYTGKPYITHPCMVAHIVKSVPHVEEQVCAAYLHDVLEDTDCTLEEIRSQFGGFIALMVDELTDSCTGCAKHPGENRQQRKARDRARLRDALPETKTVKLADLIDNSSSIMKYDPNFAKVYLREKRLLLDEALVGGDPTLWARADQIVRGSGVV
jgi:guanosine-3',5'-bis(diphosphate) 3'-pyrophosphohydrolase